MDGQPTSLGIDIGGTGVKLAAIADGKIVWTAKQGYRKPSVDELIRAIGAGLRDRRADFRTIGLCVPGLLDEHHDRVALSVNVPALMEIGLADLVAGALGAAGGDLRVTNDSVASGYDIARSRNLAGRVLVLALGTGVGAAVLDDGVPLMVDNESPGHVGQLDVSIEGFPVVGPDGGSGSLEGYIGAFALRRRYGPDPSAKIQVNDAPLRALIKAIRICHAIYRPHHIVLAGGLGIRLGRLVPALHAKISHGLTRIARAGWTLAVGDSDYHAALGAAQMARDGVSHRVGVVGNRAKSE